MKKIKKIIIGAFTICISFAMTMPVFADLKNLEESGIAPSIIKNNSNSLGYLISNGYNNTLRERTGTGANEGSLNVFGKYINESDKKEKWYETSLITDPVSGTYQLTGLFPVLSVGDNSQITNHIRLTESDGKLTGEKDGVTMNVTAKYVLEEQYIQLTFNLTSTAAKTVHFGAYTDIAINGNDTNSAVLYSNLGGSGYRLSKPTGSLNSINYILKGSSDTQIKDYVTDVDKMWIGDKGTEAENNEYYMMFAKNSTTYDSDSVAAENDAAMTFAWTDQEISADGTLTKSILIGVGPVVTITGNESYNLDDSKDVIVNGKLSDPSLQSGESNQLWYSLNGGTAKKIGEPKTDKYTDYSVNVKDDSELKTCDENNIKVWVASDDKGENIVSNIADYNFKVTSSTCAGKQVATGINISYIIITTVICGGIIAFVYSKKHSKFPQI